MSGNVWQWCADCFDQEYYKQSAERDPGGPPTGTYRVLRGGTWWDPVGECRSACRTFCVPAHRARYRGFRVVVDVAR